MHNAQIVVDGETFNCNFNGDYSGDIWIDLPIGRIPMMKGMLDRDDLDAVVQIPFEVMKTLVGQYITVNAIARIEQMEPNVVVDANLARFYL